MLGRVLVLDLLCFRVIVTVIRLLFIVSFGRLPTHLPTGAERKLTMLPGEGLCHAQCSR